MSGKIDSLRHSSLDANGLRGSEFDRRHRSWLERGGLLNRPWFFMASAPSPTVPKTLPPNTASVYIKWAGSTGRALGLPNPDLIFVNDYFVKEQTRGLDCHRVLALTAKERKVYLDRLRNLVPFIGKSLMHISDNERTRIVDTVLGTSFKGVGTMNRPSNGIALVSYAIFFGIPQIIVCGMSLTDEGHTNPNRKKHQRLHKEEDQASFAYFAKQFPGVMTSEPELAELTGLPLFTGTEG